MESTRPCPGFVLQSFSMPSEDSIEQANIVISVKVVVASAIFCIVTVGAAAAWAQNITNHLTNVDASLGEMKETLRTVRDLNVLQERTQRMEERLQRLEDWRFQRSPRSQ